MTDLERYDLYEDVICKIRFEKLMKTEQHAQLDRVFKAGLCAPAPKPKVFCWQIIGGAPALVEVQDA